jgi:glycosyltransferase involved in cell wall biosynthesis
MQNRKRILNVAVPFNTAIYDDLNSWHPLFEPLYETGLLMNFVEAVDVEPPQSAIDVANEDAKAMADYLIQKTLPNPVIKLQDIYDFILSRDILSQALIPKNVDLTFHHTAPLTLGQTPWILHIEMITNLFHPFLAHGMPSGIKLRKHAVYWLVRALLEQDNFRILFTHMHMTEAAIPGIFNSEIISSKVRYIPLGVSFSKEQQHKIDKSFSKKHDIDSSVEIFFTNSWHRHPTNFFLRGGQEVLSAFIQLQKKFPNTRLTVLSTIPESFQKTDLFKENRENPNISIIDRRVSDEELFEIVVKASIFVLPSAGLHSVSILRAMGCGAVCIVSDAPGFSEFIEHGRNGMVVKGIKDRVYMIDDETGWLQDNYETMHTLNLNIVDSMVKNLELLCDNPGLRKKLALNAMNDVRRNYDDSRFRQSFEALAFEAVERLDQIRTCRSPVKFFDTKPASPNLDRVRKKDDNTVRLIGEINGYNIVSYCGRFIAVAQSLGEVNLFKDKLGEREIMPIILLGNSEGEIRKRVKSLNSVSYKHICGK